MGLKEQLAELRAAGVRTAKLHPDGALAEVEFAPVVSAPTRALALGPDDEDDEEEALLFAHEKVRPPEVNRGE